MARDDNLDTHLSRALHDCLKIVDLEPEQYPVSVGPVIAITDRTVMVFHLEAMQLKDKLPIRDQLFIRRAPMIAPAVQETLVPSAACFDIGDGDQRLRTHPVSLAPNWKAGGHPGSLFVSQNCRTLVLMTCKNFAIPFRGTIRRPE
jgi:hypothetical protein